MRDSEECCCINQARVREKQLEVLSTPLIVDLKMQGLEGDAK